MANQQRRTRTRTTRYSTRRAAAQVRAEAEGAAILEAEGVRTGKDIDWATEYKYVYSDVRYLLIVTGALLVLLLVVGFLL